MSAKITAIPTQKISKLVQEQVFTLGYTWGAKGTSFNLLAAGRYAANYLILREDKTLGYCHREFFLQHSEIYKELTMYELFNLKKSTVIITLESGEVRKISMQSFKALEKCFIT